MNSCSCFTYTQPKKDHSEAIAKIFKALGHPIRLKIIQNLKNGERCVCDIHEGTNRELSTISSHLARLHEAGIITKEQRGKNIYYQLSCPCIGQICQCLSEHLNTK